MNDTKIDFCEDDIRDAVSRNAYAKGENYFRQGRVMDVAVKSDGSIVAHVNGTERKPYALRIQVRASGNGDAEINGDCSCPIGFNCKHVAAALLSLLHVDDDTEGLDTVPSGNRATDEPSFSYVISAWLQMLEIGRASCRERV